MSDIFTEAINAPAGRLTEILIKRAPKGEQQWAPETQDRFDRLASASGKFGRLARVRLAADVATLFEKAPNWTSERIVPLFKWNAPDSSDAWSARKYANYIGSPELFELTKEPFLQLFAKPEVAEDDLHAYGRWLIAIMIANQSGKAKYPISAKEARSALRTAGSRILATVAHRLAVEMEGANSGSKKDKWDSVVGPVFSSVWPLDAELQSAGATGALVHLITASGSAFPEAADAVIPFIRAEKKHYGMSLFSISQAEDDLFSSYPDKMLDLLVAVVGDSPPKSIWGLGKALLKLRTFAPAITSDRRFQKLTNQVGDV